MKFKTLPTQKRLKELLDYDPANGLFFWRKRKRWRQKAGSIAGRKHPKGLKIDIDGGSFFCAPDGLGLHQGGCPHEFCSDRSSRLQLLQQFIRQSTGGHSLGKSVQQASE